MHSKALSRLEFKELTAATSGPAALPLLIIELIDTHKGDATKLGVMKLAVLVRWLGVGIEGRVTREMKPDLVTKWDHKRRRFNDDQLKSRAVRAAHVTWRGRRKRCADGSGASESDSDSDVEAAGGFAARSARQTEEPANDGRLPQPNDDQRSLLGRVFHDTKDGGNWSTFAVGYDEEEKMIVAYIYDIDGPQPKDAAGCEWMGADELLDAPWADWADNRPGRCGDGPNAAIGDDDADADGAPSTNAMIADLELALAREGADARGVDDPDGQVDQPPPTVASPMGDPEEDGLPETCKAIPWRDRKNLEFFERCMLKLKGGAGEHSELTRKRELSDDRGIVFVDEDDDESGVHGTVRMKIYDFSCDDEGQVRSAIVLVKNRTCCVAAFR